MTVADKLYDIICARYDRFWRSMVVAHAVGRHLPLNPAWDDLLPRWHDMLRSRGMTPSEKFSEPPATICVKDPAILRNEWIVVPEELAFKIVALGSLP